VCPTTPYERQWRILCGFAFSIDQFMHSPPNQPGNRHVLAGS
jgi:hypothetical protein